MKVIVCRLRVGMALLCMIMAAATVFAQIDDGRITGGVEDQSKGAVKGATVKVTNERTGDVRTVAASDDGSFSVAPLKPSFYTVSISADVFSSAEMKNVQV